MTEFRFSTASGISYRFMEDQFIWRLMSDQESPIIISVPHDGFLANDLLGFLVPRQKGVKGRDKFVWPIVKDIALQIPITAIRGFFPRHFIDFNRSWPVGINYDPSAESETETALDNRNLAFVYQNYHESIASAIQRAISCYGKEKCLLIDMHGFSKQPSYGEYDIILGTGNRATVVSDIDKQLAAFLLSCGYRVFLPQDTATGRSEDIYSADFITRSNNERFAVNSIQIEIHKIYRLRENQAKGAKLSSDLAQFLSSLL